MKTIAKFFKWLMPDSMKGKAWRKEKDDVLDKGGEVEASWKF